MRGVGLSKYEFFILFFKFFSECTETSHCLSPKGLHDLGRGEGNGISKYDSLSKHRLAPKGLCDLGRGEGNGISKYGSLSKYRLAPKGL